MSNFQFENNFAGKVVGIDEVGRGPWAGPVVSSAVYIDPMKIQDKLLTEIKDSKEMSQKKRNYIYEQIITSSAFKYAIGIASVDEIDQLNILQATLLSMKRAFIKLNSLCEKKIDCALVDGNASPDLICDVKCIISGDKKSISISSASIVAKVTRDKLMYKLSKRYPGYGWEKNMGYGTSQHKIALDSLGVTEMHRKSFKPIKKIIKKNNFF